MRTASILVVGAGPAGTAAAISLARTDTDVVLIESAEFPRIHPGETLHPGVEPLFRSLGVADAINSAGFIRHAGHRIQCESSGASRYEEFGADESGKWRGYQAPREKLDSILLAQAARCGVRVLQPCTAKNPIVKNGRVKGVETDYGPIRANTVLDATGLTQWLVRKLDIETKKRSKQSLTRYGYVEPCKAELTNQELEQPMIRLEKSGWTWLARISRDKLAWARLRNTGEGKESEWIPEEIIQYKQVGRIRGADTTCRIADRLAGPGWFLVGDSGAVLDPLSSHGVMKAIMSGMMAAHLITSVNASRIKPHDAELTYSNWLTSWFNTDVKALRKFYTGN